MGIEFDPGHSADVVAQLLRELGLAVSHSPGADQSRLLVQIQGLLMESGDLRRRAETAERKLAELVDAEPSPESRPSSSRATVASLTEKLRIREAELNAAVRRSTDLERRVAESELRILSLERELSSSQATPSGGAPPRSTPKPGTSQPRPARTPRGVPLFTEGEPPDAREAYAPKEETFPHLDLPADDDEAAWVLPKTNKRATLVPANAEVDRAKTDVQMDDVIRAAGPTKTLFFGTPKPATPPSAAESSDFGREMRAGGKIRPTERFADSKLFEASSLIAAVWTRPGGTLTQIAARSGGLMTEGRLLEILLDFYQRELIEFDRS
jgi:hypothetical protein